MNDARKEDSRPSSERFREALLLRRMITGYWLSQAIYVAAKFGIADLLSSGAQPVSVLAGKTGADEALLFRILRAAASEGVFRETSPKTFELTPLGELLCSDYPYSLRAYAVLYGEEVFRAFSRFGQSVQNGVVPFEAEFGQSFFHFLEEHPRQAQIFNDAMKAVTRAQIDAVLAAYDFGEFSTVADIGGGTGSLLEALLLRYPKMRGRLYDLEPVVSSAKKALSASAAGARVTFECGSFFDHVPPGADAYILKYIVHDWDDERAIQILQRCREAVKPKSKLLLVEQVIAPGNNPQFAKLADLHMHTLCGGKERSETEFRTLCEHAEFRIERIVETPYLLSVVEAVPVEGGVGK